MKFAPSPSHIPSLHSLILVPNPRAPTYYALVHQHLVRSHREFYCILVVHTVYRSKFVRKGTTVEVTPSVDLTIHTLVLVPSEDQRTFCRTSLLMEYIPKGGNEPTTITIGSLYPDKNWIKQQSLSDTTQPLPIKHTGRARPQESCRCNLILNRNASYRFSIRGDKQYDGIFSRSAKSRLICSSIIQLIGTFVSPHDGNTKVKVYDDHNAR